MLKLYAKQVPTNDPVLDRDSAKGRYDTLIARDSGFRDIAVRWPWYKANRPTQRRTVVLNCYKWELVWEPQEYRVAFGKPNKQSTVVTATSYAEARAIFREDNGVRGIADVRARLIVE